MARVAVIDPRTATGEARHLFTNLLGKATQVEIDFPRIELRQ